MRTQPIYSQSRGYKAFIAAPLLAAALVGPTSWNMVPHATPAAAAAATLAAVWEGLTPAGLHMAT
jgi:hypothetical protein